MERLDERHFTGGSDLSPGGTVGAHFRHCVDFYDALFRGLESGRIDYDDRTRDPACERSPKLVSKRLEDILRTLEAIRDADRDGSLRVRGDGPNRGDDGWTRSTLGRELQFLLSHTIHHFALIGFILRARGVAIDRSFGVAPSTLRHWARPSAPAS